MIDFLATLCSVNPNAPFQRHGQAKPLLTERSLTEELPEVGTDCVEEYTPLSLLLSYYITYRELDQNTIQNCMKLLIQLGARLSFASYYYYSIDGDRKDCSLLMAAFQNRLIRDSDSVDFFKFLLEKKAMFSDEDEEPLANFLNNRDVLSVDVLALFY